nr:translation initiation factor IF-2 [Candidatus Gracilibacteria bacterium]
MVDKNVIVDDYYSKVDSSSSQDEANQSKKKIKFVSKNKEVKHDTIVVEEDKKVHIKKNNENKLEENKVEVHTESKFKIKKVVEPVEKDLENQPVEENTEEKKVFKFRKVVKEEEKPVKKHFDNGQKDRELNSDSSKKQNNPPIRPILFSDDQEKADGAKSFNFGDSKFRNGKKGKGKEFGKDEEGFSKKKQLFNKKFDSKRGYNYLEEDEGEKEVTFTRSNKLLGKKKEEKNVEDMVQNLTSREGEEVIIGDVLTLKELSEKMGIAFSKLIAEFMKNGMLVNINSKIDFESASIIAETFGIKLVRDKSAGISASDILTGNISDLLKEDDASKLVKRPPVISIMGHVDHGKTSLLDYIRKEKVASGEAGGITQSIGAYQVEQNGQKITFLDTPGHEAFTVMRARGAKSTDIAILVVAADEGVKPQTVESINHAKEAGIPVVVAINKMDKEGANPENVKAGLSEHGLVPEDWGGDVPMIPVSAKTGFGVDDLLGVILLISEMQDYKANPNRLAVATVIESHLDQKLGPVATVLINTGTINKGDSIVCNDSYGKVKVLKDYASKGIKEAFPGDPVLIIGLDKVVEGGDVLQVVSDVESARLRASEYAEIMHSQKVKSMTGIDLIMSKIKSGSLKQLKVVVKADTNGSLEAIKASITKLSTEETTVSVIHSGVGNISEGDILMCQGSQAILVGFRVSVLPTAKSLIESSKVEFINSEIIYHITDKIEKIVTGMLDPKEVETILGKATVGGIFYSSKEFMILGLKIKDESIIENGAKIRVIRGDKMIGKGDIKSLKQGVEEVNKVEGPTECGIKFVGNMNPEMGDILEIYKVDIINKR